MVLWVTGLSWDDLAGVSWRQGWLGSHLQDLLGRSSKMTTSPHGCPLSRMLEWEQQGAPGLHLVPAECREATGFRQGFYGAHGAWEPSSNMKPGTEGEGQPLTFSGRKTDLDRE